MSDSRRYIRHSDGRDTDIVFDKSVFSSVFYKDIRRVYIYKKAERLANALYLIAPAFRDSVSLRARAEALAVGLTEAAAAPAATLAEALARELLALSSLLSMAQAGGLLSAMNADLIRTELQSLLAETASYEEPGLMLGEDPTLAALARRAAPAGAAPRPDASERQPAKRGAGAPAPSASARQESILSLIKGKGTVSIKDISLVIRGVSDKTLQRELQSLIEAGRLVKRGERRWSTYALA